MEIWIEGGRILPEDWDASRDLSADQLPALTPDQKVAVNQRRISEEEYARDLVAERLTTEKLAQRTARVGRFFQQKLKAIEPAARIQRISLDTLQGKYEVEIGVNGHRVPATVRESIVDDLFEAGSPEAERRISRVLELALITPGRLSEINRHGQALAGRRSPDRTAKGRLRGAGSARR